MTTWCSKTWPFVSSSVWSTKSNARAEATKRVIHVGRRVDQRGLDQGRGGSGIGVALAIKLHKHGCGSGSVRAGLAGAALVLIEVVNRGPRILIAGRSGLQRGDPGARRDHVGFDAAIRAWAAARKIRHRIRAIAVNQKVRPIVFRRAGGDDVLGDCGTADGLCARPRVAGGEFEYVRLITQRQSVGIADQLVKLHRADIIRALSVITPTVGADHRARASRVAGQPFETRRRLEIPNAIKNPLRDDARPRGNAQTVEGAVVISFTGRPIPCNDAGDVRAMAGFVGGISQIAVIKKTW